MVLDSNGLHNRAAFFRCIRNFFEEHGFLEVDTPIRQPVYIPESNILPIAAERWFLQSSPEICMKRLLSLGDNDLFQICHCFRKGEKGRLHLEEFMMLEWYRKGADYEALMQDCIDLFRCLQITLKHSFCQGTLESLHDFWNLDLNHYWERITVEEAFARYAPCSLEEAMEEKRFEEILVEFVEPNLGNILPTFLYDYPASMASLARIKPSRPAVAERFELYYKGVEIANGFSELTDVSEQRRRFEEEIRCIASTQGRAAILPERFLKDLERLETAAGIALGLDRLFMLLGGYHRINDAVSFSSEDYF